MKNFQTIALSKRYLIVNTEDDINVEDYHLDKLSIEEISPAMIQLQAEVMRYGYIFDEKCIKYLSTLSKDDFDSYAKDVEKYLIDAYGDNGLYASLFGNFPYGVMEMSETEFFLGQFVHYLTGADMRNHSTTDDAELRIAYSGCIHDDYKKIEPISVKKFLELFNSILSSQQSLTIADKENVKYLCHNYEKLKFADGTSVKYEDVFPETIPFKETLCIVASELKQDFKFNTITDILRVIVYLSGGNPALPTIPTYKGMCKGTPLDPKSKYNRLYERRRSYYTKSMIERLRENARASINQRYENETREFKISHFKRSDRKMILSMIEKFLYENSSLVKQEQILEDMKRYLERWIRVGEILHPGEYAKKFPKTSEIFVILRNAGQYISTYNGKIDSARRNGNIDDLLVLYKQRPGEFARNLDNLLRNNFEFYPIILNEFKSVVSSISTKMLYELLDHFYLRNTSDKLNNRAVTPKGSRTAIMIPNLPKMDSGIQNKLIDILFTELVARFSAKPSLEGERYFIDSKLKNVMLPKNMRSMNFAVGQLPQGTKYDLKADTGILRFYCRWDDPEGTRDLDLSACLMKNETDKPMFISWDCHRYNNSSNNWWVFSGDVRQRKGKCAEYIDINVVGALNEGYKHLILTVNDFNYHGFLVEDAYCGVMEREQLGVHGDTTWAPDTITLGFRLTSPSTNVVAAYINLEDLTMTIVDEDYTGDVIASLNGDSYKYIVKKYSNYQRMFNVYSLIKCNIQARDGIVEDIEYSKEELKKSIKQLKDLKEYFDKKMKSSTSEEIVKAYMDTVDYLNQYQYVLDHTIEYDDITRDYTSILEWMF